MSTVLSTINDIQLAIPIHLLQMHQIAFLETKKNMIMDGKFTKLIYTDDHMALHGLTLALPFKFLGANESQSQPPPGFSPLPTNISSSAENATNIIANKYTSRVFGGFPININSLQTLESIERRLLEYYIQSQQLVGEKIAMISFSDIIRDKQIKVYREADVYVPYMTTDNDYDNASTLIIRISGIWENKQEVGLIFKFFEPKP